MEQPEYMTFGDSEAWQVRVIADSQNDAGKRLTTLEIRYPRIVLAEFNTHRVLSRNSASSRAIPFHTMLSRVKANAYIPTEWGLNQPGMQAEVALADPEQIERARTLWLQARDYAIMHARALADMGIHKQIVNRLLEPFMWHVCLTTSTEWDNFIGLRDNPAAQPEIREAATLVRRALEESQPNYCRHDEWHLPFIDDYDWAALMLEHPPEMARLLLREISVARCARVSYLTHDGRRDHQADLTLYRRLLDNRHMSPFEHVAAPQPADAQSWSGNFFGWNQFRKAIAFEDNALAFQAWQARQGVEV